MSLDIFLPDMLGWNVLSQFKRTLETRHIPVQILSMDEDRQQGLARGAFSYLNKPTTTEGWSAALSRINEYVRPGKKRLLIAEDNEAERFGVSELLAHPDVEIATADSGRGALDKLREQRFDCMVLDLRLPDISGFEVLEEIQKDEALADLPVVVFTGRDLSPEEDTRLHTMARSIVVKGAASPERLFDETALFLHQVADDLPEDKKRMLERLHSSDEMLAGRTVLVVDDDTRNIFALSSALERRGMRVLTATTGREAISILERAPEVAIVLMDIMMPAIDGYETIALIQANWRHEAVGMLLKTEDVAVVLIDVVMPGVDGFQLAAMIREHPRFQKLAIIFVSAVQVGEMDHLRGYEIGAVDYVSVPVIPKVLRAKVREFVDLYRKTRQLEVLNSELEARVAARTAELEAQTERLRQSEEGRSIARSAGDMGSWEVDLATGHLEWDDGPYRIFGVDPAHFEPTVERIEAMMHPDDREKNALAAIVGSGESRFQVEFRIVRPSGEVRWCYGAGIITRAAAGNPVRITAGTADSTDRKRAEERQVLLAREVDHRAKNTLAVVLSVLRLTRAPTTEDFIATAEGRVHALAATHNLLSATGWG